MISVSFHNTVKKGCSMLQPFCFFATDSTSISKQLFAIFEPLTEEGTERLKQDFDGV